MKHNYRRGAIKRNDKKCNNDRGVEISTDNYLDVRIQAHTFCLCLNGRERQRARHGAKHFINSRRRFHQKMMLKKLRHSKLFYDY